MPGIIMHFPKKQEDVYILQKKVAQVHAEAVVKHLEKLPFPKEQKLALINVIKLKYPHHFLKNPFHLD